MSARLRSGSTKNICNRRLPTLFHLGSIHQKLGSTDRALEYLKRGLKIAEEIGARPKEERFSSSAVGDL